MGAASVILFGERPSAIALVGWAAILLGLMIVYAGSAQA